MHCTWNMYSTHECTNLQCKSSKQLQRLCFTHRRIDLINAAAYNVDSKRSMQEQAAQDNFPYPCFRCTENFTITNHAVRSRDYANYIFASLCYWQRNSHDTFMPGLYEIQAKIVTFLPHVHKPSPMYDNNALTLMGDIQSNGNDTESSQKLQRLEFDHDFRDLQNQAPAKITIAGLVCGRNQHAKTFTVSISQSISGLSDLAPLTIDIMVDPSDSSIPTQILPDLNTIVMFSARIMNIVHDTLRITNEDHSFFYSSQHSVTEETKNATSQT
ncbi:hypothetical protein V8E53_014403 [Lactarius tabidus]